MKAILLKVLNFIFPLNCFHCHRQDLLASKIGICRNCAKLPKVSVLNHCDTCGSRLFDGTCLYCNSRNVFFEKLLYIRERDELEKKIIQNIKFHKQPYLGGFFRFGLNRLLFSIKNIPFNGIVYIPSNRKTLRERPIYPYSYIVRKIQKYFAIPKICPFRKMSKELQSGKTYRDRFLHARFAFEILPEYNQKLSGNYLLVDDVFTTGATVNEIARLLKINGAENVYILVLTKGLDS